MLVSEPSATTGLTVVTVREHRGKTIPSHLMRTHLLGREIPVYGPGFTPSINIIRPNLQQTMRQPSEFVFALNVEIHVTGKHGGIMTNHDRRNSKKNGPTRGEKIRTSMSVMFTMEGLIGHDAKHFP